ncbi:respiratory nitrite reductase (cytochrome ammonia-forming) precursor [Anaerovirgula multivorans]|uniref:nitrite reductase (cytochrome; ammonia-forming) n=1 Tax=Anaerovirgula multivorans TaxID=312168 RepID=A0A239CZH9_9FIRM|nr:ammonia-forming cytochrome c nitrite reductase subunit c552 [Anaerovirgula multivorans]SNS25041.1 respiratory nitrite reductase (cytochrome ammonia-forming) precursor [Anaerovirgula multivorans]
MKKNISWIVICLTIIAIITINVGCARQEEGPPQAEEPGEGLQIPLGEIPAPEDMILDAAHWEEEYPMIYESFIRTSRMGDFTVEDSTLGGLHPVDYLEKYPNIKILYDGIGFSKEYYAARGHYYSLEDVINTERPKPGASCLACKTADYEKLFVEHGEDMFALDFHETVQGIENSISCYNCHRNEPGQNIQVTAPHLAVGLTKLEQEPPAGTLACAQCHVEYYFNPDTKEVVLPWDNGIEIEDIEAYFEERGFYDWKHPRTGTPLIKVQHPEFEMYTGSIHDRMGVSCADCHMPTVEEEGETYRSHWAKSPLKTVEESCGGCHKDGEAIIAQTEEIQREIDDMQVEVSGMIVELVEDFAAALEERDLEEATVEELWDLHRKAQYRWDFVMVENSTGFHHWEKARKALEEAKEFAQQALDILAEQQ